MYDYKIDRMPLHRFEVRRDDKLRRIWQVIMIERDEWGKPVKDLQVQRDNLTYDEAFSLANQLTQELRKTEWGSKDK